MKLNVGSVDRAVRLLLGAALIALFFVLSGPVRYVGILGFVFVGTALIGFCPLYMPFGITTNKK